MVRYTLHDSQRLKRDEPGSAVHTGDNATRLIKFQQELLSGIEIEENKALRLSLEIT